VQELAAGATGNEGGALATDVSGNIFVAGHSHFSTSQWDIVLSKYSATGEHLWQNRFDALAGNDFGVAVAVNDTNIFVTGSSLNTSGDYDILTLKYSTNGTREWSARYAGPGHGLDFAHSAAADSAGNVIVAGNSTSLSNGLDFVVLKYSAGGVLLWAFRYDGVAGRDDRVAGMQTDASGNTYLAGQSDQSGTSPEIVTIKVGPDGEQLWAARWTKPPGTYVRADGLALDNDGNVIVVGTEAFGTRTLKYSPTGELLWAAHHRLEEPAPLYASDVRVDSGNNIVVGANVFGSGTNDALLLKYNSAGEQLWISRIPHLQHGYHLNAIDMGADGSVYVTGSPHNDMMTVKVAPNGNQVWSVIFNSVGLYHDVGEFLEVDNAGNVIVAGRSLYFGSKFVSVVKYQQNNIADAPVIIISPTNQVVVSGSTVTFSASATGTGPLSYQWRFTGRPIPGANGPTLTLHNVQAVNRGDYSVVVSNSAGVTVSPESRLTVLVLPTATVTPESQTSFVGAQAAFSVTYQGTTPFTFQWRHEGTNIPGATNDVLQISTVALSDAGSYSVVVANPAGAVTSSIVTLNVSLALEQTAALRFNGAGNGDEANPFLHVTPQREKIVVLSSEGLGTRRDIVTLKYSPADELIWARSFHRGEDDEDIPADSAVDAMGNIYVTGSSGESHWDRTCTTLKYNAEGELLWARHFRETNGYDSFATSLAIDANGNVTVAASSAGRAIVIRYAPNGDELWIARASEPWLSERQGLAVDATGNSYLGTIVDVINAEDENSEFFLRKLDPNGEIVWTRTFDAGWGEDVTEVLVDRNRNIIVAGSAALTNQRETVVFKYNPDGERLWFTNITGAPGVFSFNRAVTLDHMGDVLVASGLEDYDDDLRGMSIARISAQGEVLWAVTESDLYLTYFPRIALDRFGNFYITGYQRQAATGSDIATAKYSPDGNREWLVHYAGPGFSSDQGTSVGVDAQGDVFVAGTATALTGGGADMVLLHYTQENAAPKTRIVIQRDAGCIRFKTPAGIFSVEVSEDLRTWTRMENASEVEALLEAGIPLPSSAAQKFYRFVWDTE
jgi:uncharacterized delta-60 repeat protein